MAFWGSKRAFYEFVWRTKAEFVIRVKGVNVRKAGGAYELCEAQAPYQDDFAPKNGVIGLENTYFWNVYS